MSLSALLTLPADPAFTTFRSPSAFGAAEDSDTRSGSPPRKVPRLANDSDSASASRSRAAVVGGQPRDVKTIVLKLKGTHIESQSDSFYDREVALLQRSIRVLLSRGNPEDLPGTYERIYSACQTTVITAQRGESIYENLKLEMERCLVGLVRQLLDDPKNGVEWIATFNDVCEWFTKQIGIIKSLFAHLDRVYLVSTKKQDIGTLAYAGFAERVFDDMRVINRIREGIRTWSEWERRNYAPHEHRNLIPALINHLRHHGQFQAVFEQFYVDTTLNFYVAEAKESRQTMSAKDFLRHCEDRSAEEQARAQEVSLESSQKKIVDTTNRAMLGGHLDWVATEALPPLMDPKEPTSQENRIKHLRSMYRLFQQVENPEILLAAFKLFIKGKVKSIVTDTANDENMVPSLLDFKAFCDRAVAEAFFDNIPSPKISHPSQPSSSTAPIDVDATPVKAVPNQEFTYAVVDAFQSGFKFRRSKPAEMIAKQIDKAMRRGQKGKDTKSHRAELEATLELYRFTDDKDVFRTFYHRALAKRLLLEKSASDDDEKIMLKRLKERYDAEFDMGEQMFKDLQLSRDLMREYEAAKDYVAEHKWNAMILQRGAWPFAARKQSVALPMWMSEELERYTAFYRTKHAGRKLDWDHALGTATLRANFNAGTKELSVSLYQSIILLLFNDSDEISFRDIKSLMQMEDAELRRTLQSLACGKKRVLKKLPAGKDVDDDDVFQYNPDFTDNAFRVHINSIQVKETAEESKRAQSMIEADRKNALDAAIVRIMKGSKEMQYEHLLAKTIEAVSKHFRPEVTTIKKRIDSLVEQDYLSRDEEDMNTLKYVA